MTHIFEGEGPMTFDQTKALADLTRGNEPDRGWKEAPAGNFYASVYDRRRLAVSAINLYAENNHVMAVRGSIVKSILVSYFAVGKDSEEIIKNFLDWKARTSAQ